MLTLGVRPWTHSVLLTAMYWDWLSGLNRLSGHERCIAVGSEGGEHDSISEGDDWPPGQTVDIVFLTKYSHTPLRTKVALGGA